MPATAAAVVWSVRLNVVVVSVDALIASENVAVGAVAVDCPVAPFAGVKPVTVGGVVSGAAAVVNVQVDVRGEAVARDVGDAGRAAQDPDQ